MSYRSNYFEAVPLSELIFHEANEGFSDKDFEYKIYIALKEARESEYWLELLSRTEYISKIEYDSINADCTELLRLLVSITKTLSSNRSATDK